MFRLPAGSKRVGEVKPMEYDLLENREFEDWLVKLRREFHRYPEPGWLEYRTTVRIIEERNR